MERNLKRIFILVLLLSTFFLNGCATLLTRFNEQPDPEFHFYAATICDSGWFYGAIVHPKDTSDILSFFIPLFNDYPIVGACVTFITVPVLSAIDMIFSIVSDTILLPYDVYCYFYKYGLLNAVREGDYDWARFLLGIWANPSGYGGCNAPLVEACEKNDIRMVELLVQSGADINAESDGIYYNNTPLNSACRNGNLEIVKFLVGKGADWKQGNEGSRLIRSSNDKIARYLIEIGANINYISKEFPEKGTILDEAIRLGWPPSLITSLRSLGAKTAAEISGGKK